MAIRYGLVELFVPLPETVGGGAPYEDRDAIARAMRRWCEQHRAERVQAVVDVLTAPALQGVNLLIFPGWTLPIGDEAIPKEVRGAIGERTVVLETFGPRVSKTGHKLSGCRSTHVLQGNARLIDPAPQWIATAEDAEDGNAVDQVVRALRGPRRWSVGSHARCTLAICGEVNVVKHSAQGDWALHDGLPRALKGVDVVVNPAHTRTSLEAMRSKRRWFAEGRVLLTTANLHGPVRVWGWNGETHRWVRRRASSKTAAEVFVGAATSVRVPRDKVEAELGGQVILVGLHKVSVVAHVRLQEKLRG